MIEGEYMEDDIIDLTPIYDMESIGRDKQYSVCWIEMYGERCRLKFGTVPILGQGIMFDEYDNIKLAIKDVEIFKKQYGKRYAGLMDAF